MKDPILLNKLWQEVEAGRVSASQTGSLTIFKYTQSTHIDGTWNETNRVARGIIFDVDGTIVARPFPKFFNLNEREETKPGSLPWKSGVEVYEKVDGSCGAGYVTYEYVDGVGEVANWRLATPGSMESEQALYGTEMLNEWTHDCPGLAFAETGEAVMYKRYKLEHLPLDCTPVFEIIYPENQIVVNYGDTRELVLLAIFEHNGTEWHPKRVDQIAELCGFRRPRRYDISADSLKRNSVPFEDNEEGYVCRFGDGTRVKIKSPRYLQLHRLLDNLSPKGVIELIRGREYGVTIQGLPNELVLRFDDIRAHVQGIHNEIHTEAAGHYACMMSELGENRPRKAYALWVQGNVPNALTGLVFSLLDGKEIDDNIWRMVLERVKEE